jgi:hypothetical protein
VARTISRAAGWVLTGPLAFLLAVLIDFAVLGFRSLTQRN